ncbi:MAG TPA: hypothetical protein VGQ83_23045 [Polyangia bacterium]|jgi:hypothetical protein
MMTPVDLDLQVTMNVAAYSPLFLDPDQAEQLNRQSWRVRLGVLEPDPRKIEEHDLPLERPAAVPGALDYDYDAAHDPDVDRDHTYDCVCDWTWLFSPPCLTRAWACRLGVLLPDAP